MTADLTTLQNITEGLQSYIVAPLNAFGLGGFLFDTEAESIAQLTADITDHYTEDNRALQDHIAIRPKRITLKGYVGELVYVGEGQAITPIQTLTQKLTEISSYLPQLTAGAQQIQQAITTPNPTTLPLSPVANIYGLVKNLLGTVGTGSKQQNAYQYFEALQKQAVLMAIQTPWEFLTNMAIESIFATQPEESKFITDFSVTFKQIRIATTTTVALTQGSGTQNPTPPVSTGDAAVQDAAPTVIGITPGISLPSISLPGAQSALVNGASLLGVPAIASVFAMVL